MELALASILLLALLQPGLSRTMDMLGPVDDYLRYPPRPLPDKACACRVDMERRAVAAACPTPWDHPAGYSKVPPALTLSEAGDLVDSASGKRALMHGINWFGWETANPSMDGLWAYGDTELPPKWAITNESMNKLQLEFWQKRTMTNDFAHVVHRMRALGFNAVRLPMNFTNLQKDIPQPKGDPSEFYACVRDDINHMNLDKTLDPALSHLPSDKLAAAAPAYTGMQHPPPVRPDDDARCSFGWDATWAGNYTPSREFGDKLKLTMCNWYLPQGEGVQALHRFLWQVQYLVSQGFYVMIDHQSYAEYDPNMLNSALFSSNWGNLWRIITELPGYEQHLKGRIFPDLVNEPSRWGCQWDRECYDSSGRRSCAQGFWLYHDAMRSIHTWDPDVPIFANAMGQSRVDPVRFPTCQNYFDGMNYGEGTITNRAVIQATGISDPLIFFTELPKTAAGKLALAPHVYPATLTGLGLETQSRQEMFKRFDLSFGLKALGKDMTSDMKPLQRMAVVLGEFGVRDHGQPRPADTLRIASAAAAAAATQFSDIRDIDVTFLKDLSDYLKGIERQGATVSWFWWAWNANSGDTKGIVGPDDTWRDIQFKKIQLLTRLYGLRPWYCDVAPEACPCEGAGCVGGQMHIAV